MQALMDALPTTLHNCAITSVISNSKDAYGLIRAASHCPPIPASSYSPYQFQKANSSLFGDDEKKLKELGDAVKRGEGSEGEWKKAKSALAARVKPLYQLELAKRVRDTKPDLIVLAGFMLILLPDTLSALARNWTEDSSSAGVEAPNTLPTLGSSPYPSTLSVDTPIPIINLHPALPGAFVGPHVIEDAWEAFNQRKIPTAAEEESGKASKDAGEPIKALADSLASTSLSSSDPPAADSPFGPRITQTGIQIHRVIPELDRGAPVLWREIPMKEGESVADLKERIHDVEHEAIVQAVAQVTRELGSGRWWKEE